MSQEWPPYQVRIGGRDTYYPYPAILLVFVLALVPCALQAEGGEEAHTQSTLPGALILDGPSFSFLHGQPLSHIQVLAVHHTQLIPIPFQIDERSRRGRWVIKAGPRPSRDDSPGLFDTNDAIVFLRRDIGPQANAAALPQEVTAWHEVRLGHPKTPLGFVYIGVGRASTQPHLPFPVRYDPQRDRVYAERYSVAFDAPLPSHLAFVDALGDFGHNTISGISVAGEVQFLGGLLSISRTDEDLQSRLYGYTQGPVRLIRRARYWFPLPLGLRATGRIDLIFYPDFVEGTALVKLKIPPRFVLADGELSTYFNFLDFGQARLVQEGSVPIHDPQKDSEKQSVRWAALQLPTGQTLLLVTRLEGRLQQLEQQVYFSTTDQPDSGQPSFGFHFSEVSRLDAGSYRLSVFGVRLDTHSPEAIRSTAAFFLSPPSVSVSPIETTRQD